MYEWVLTVFCSWFYVRMIRMFIFSIVVVKYWIIVVDEYLCTLSQKLKSWMVLLSGNTFALLSGKRSAFLFWHIRAHLPSNLARNVVALLPWNIYAGLFWNMSALLLWNIVTPLSGNWSRHISTLLPRNICALLFCNLGLP